MEVEFQGQYDKAIIFKAVALASKPSRRNMNFRIGISVFSIAVYAAFSVFEATRHNLPPLNLLLSPSSLLLLAVIAYFFIQPRITSYFIASRLWRNPALQHPLSGAISSEGVAYFSSSKGRRDFAWESFVKKQLSEDMITLVSSDGVLSIFPRSFFKSDPDWNTVRLWVLENVVEGKRSAKLPENEAPSGQS